MKNGLGANTKMKIELEIDLDKFRWSLVGDGYLYEEARELSQDKLKEILSSRINNYILIEYRKSLQVIRDHGYKIE